VAVDDRAADVGVPVIEPEPSRGAVDPLRDWHALGIVTAALIGSRLVYYVLGVRFLATGELNYLPQVLAPELLKHHLFESIWYLHAQPPLFNLLIGAVLSWSPFPAGLSFQVIFVATGLALAIGCYDLARQLVLGRRTAIVVTLIVVCGPSVVLWESVLNYDYIVATFLVWMVSASARYVRSGGAGPLAVVVVLGAATVLLRSFMHPLFVVGLVVVLLLLRRPTRWNARVIAAIVIPIAVVGGTMAKNEVLFGTTSLSSFLGYNLHRVTVTSLSFEKQRDLRARLIIRAPDFAPPCNVKHPNIPALADEFKVGVEPPTVNSNWECLLYYEPLLVDDSKRVIRAEPGWVFQSFIGSAEIWAAPSTLYWETAPNARHISGFDRAYRYVVYTDVPWSPPVDPRIPYVRKYFQPDGHYHLSLTVVLTTMLVLCAGVIALLQWRRRRTSARAALIVGAAIVGYATITNLVLGHDENNRLRFIVDPLVFVMAFAIVAAWVRERRRARAAAVSKTPTPLVTQPRSD
jgi:hypothetical protein